MTSSFGDPAAFPSHGRSVTLRPRVTPGLPLSGGRPQVRTVVLVFLTSYRRGGLQPLGPPWWVRFAGRECG